MTTFSFYQSVQKRIRWEEIDGLRENGRKDSQHVPAARLLQRAVRKSGSAWLKRKKKNYKVVNANTVSGEFKEKIQGLLVEIDTVSF